MFLKSEDSEKSLILENPQPSLQQLSLLFFFLELLLGQFTSLERARQKTWQTLWSRWPVATFQLPWFSMKTVYQVSGTVCEQLDEAVPAKHYYKSM